MAKQKSSGFFARVLKAIRRRGPKTFTYTIFTGPPDISYAGAVRAKGFELVEITRENLDRALEFREPRFVKTLHAYLDRGFKGWFSVLGDTIVGYAFMAAITDKPRIVRNIILHPGEAAAILVYARPEYRIFGVGPAMTREISAKAAATDGVEQFVLWADPKHERWYDSLKNYRMEPAGRVWILRLWGRSVIRRTTGSPVKR